MRAGSAGGGGANDATGRVALREHRGVSVLHRVVGVLHRVVGVPHGVVGVLHRVVGVKTPPTYYPPP